MAETKKRSSNVQVVDTNDPIAWAKFCAHWEATAARERAEKGLTDEEIIAIYEQTPNTPIPRNSSCLDED